MPSKYLTRVLRGLGAVYRFPGQVVSPPSLDLELPLQLVSDVGPLAAEASIVRRMHVITAQTGGAGVAQFVSLPYQDLFPIPAPADPRVDDNSWDPWLRWLGLSVSVNPANFSVAWAALVRVQGTAVPIQEVLMRGDTVHPSVDNTTNLPVGNLEANRSTFFAPRLPTKLGRDSTLFWRVTDDGGAQVTWRAEAEILYCPAGVVPV